MLEKVPENQLAGRFIFCYEDHMDIGQRLYELRAAKGFSQGDVEKRTGLLRCYISRVENGHTIPSLEMLEELAAGLEIKLSQLFVEGGKKPGNPPLPRPQKLKFDEQRLVDSFKRLDKRDRGLVLGMIRDLARTARSAK